MAKNRSGDSAESKQCAEPNRARRQYKDDRDKLNNPRTDPPERLQLRAKDGRKNVFRFLGSSEFEVESLKQNERHDNSTDPANNIECFRHSFLRKCLEFPL